LIEGNILYKNVNVVICYYTMLPEGSNKACHSCWWYSIDISLAYAALYVQAHCGFIKVALLVYTVYQRWADCHILRSRSSL